MTPTLMRDGCIAIFGGSGATGRALIANSLAAGFKARVLARRAGSVSFGSELVQVVERALSRPEDVLATLQGCSAAICVFGPRPPYVDVFCEQATVNIINAMRQLGVRRLVCQTGGMIGDYRPNRTLPFQLMADAFSKHSPQIAADRDGQERAVMQSGLDWTIVKPPRLTNGAAKGKWRAGADVRIGMLSGITRADLADFLVKAASSSQYVGQAVFVRN